MNSANEPDQINTGALATIIGIVAISTLGIGLFVNSLVRDETRALGSERQGTQERGIRELRAEQLSTLTATPTWKDRATGAVTLPIDAAKSFMVEAVSKRRSALSPWLPPPPPQGSGGAAGEAAGSGGDAAANPEGAGGTPAEDDPAGAIPASEGVSASNTPPAVPLPVPSRTQAPTP